MTEFIIHLTDEQEALLRRPLAQANVVQLMNLRDDVEQQVRDALALYDELVAEAKAKSDD